jgi:hypothetical protein
MAKKRILYVQTWTVFIYRPHPSGIGSVYVGQEEVTTKPSFETHFFDETNGKWARYENGTNKP